MQALIKKVGASILILSLWLFIGSASVYAQAFVVPSSATVQPGDQNTFAGNGGIAPYAFNVIQDTTGGATIDFLTGLYTAGPHSGTSTIHMTDSTVPELSANAVVTVVNPIPGTTQAENYDGGGEGVGYHELTPGNTGGQFRSDDVDIEVSTDAGGGFNVGWAWPDEWLAYEMEIAESGTYLLELRVARGQPTPGFMHLEVNGVDVTGTVTIPSTGGFQNWTTVSIPGIALTAGTHEFRVVFEIGFNFNWMRFTQTNIPLTITPPVVTLGVGGQITFAGVDGVPPYTYSVEADTTGGATVNATTGLYTAGPNVGTSTVRVTDSLAATADAVVTVNAALTITPPVVTLGVGGQITFAGVDGVPPYTYSVEADTTGGATVNATTGLYTAGPNAGTSTVRVTDSLAATADAVVTVNAALAINPATVTLAVSGTQTFNGVGGVAPYTYSVEADTTGGATVNATTGEYTAGPNAGTSTVRVTDSLAATVDAAVTVNPALAINPATVTLAVSGTQTFNGVGGVAPYTYSVEADTTGGATVNATTGLYMAGPNVGTSTVRVTDSLAATVDAAVTVNAALTIDPAAVTLVVDSNQTFNGVNGVGPYTYSLEADTTGGATVNATTGLYTAGPNVGTSTVRVTDSLAATADAAVTVNAALTIDPVAVTVVVNGTQTFNGVNGVGPYTYSVEADTTGGATVNATTGLYTAGPNVGTSTVRVTDSLAATADAVVTVNAALTIDPVAVTVVVNGTQTFNGVNGVGPYTYSVEADTTGGATVNATTGEYTAGPNAGTSTVRVTDSLAATADAVVTVNAALAINPATVTLAVSGTQTFNGVGGVAPYTYSVEADTTGGATVNATTGLYTAGPNVGTSTVRVTDSLAATVDAAVTVNAALTITPPVVTLGVGGQITFAGVDGVPPYTYSVEADTTGGATVNATTGLYTAGPNVGTSTVRVTDSLAATADAVVTVNAALTITPPVVTLGVGGQITFAGVDGVPPYTYSVEADTTGGATVNATTGLYTAGPNAGTSTVRVTDSLAATADAVVTVNAALAINPATVTLAVSGTQTFNGVGGVAPYTYSVEADTTGGATVNATTGEYTAGPNAGTSTVRVTDSLAATVDAAVTVNPALAINPATVTLAVSGTQTFNGVGGVAPYTYSVEADTTGGATVNATTGLYMAGPNVGTSTVRVTDSLAATVDAAVTVNAALTIDPAAVTLVVDSNQTFNGVNGVGPYTYSLEADTTGGATVNATTGLYTAGPNVGTSTVRVTDSLAATADAVVTVMNEGVTINPPTVTLGVNGTQTFSGSGGTAPYAFVIDSDTTEGATIGFLSGLYAAGPHTGTSTVHITDSTVPELSADAIVTVARSIPGRIEAEDYNGGGEGVGYHEFTAGNTGGQYRTDDVDIETTTDIDGTYNVGWAWPDEWLAYEVDVTATGTYLLEMRVARGQPTSGFMHLEVDGVNVTGTITIPSTGGFQTWSTVSIPGISLTAGVHQIRVYFEIGFNINWLSFTQTGGSLAINPAAVTVGVGGNQTFNGVGGVAPYTYSLEADTTGGATVNATTGEYTAGPNAGTSTVRVTDSLAATADATVTVNAALTIDPAAVTVGMGGNQTFNGVGGVAPYTYSVEADTTGGATVNATTGGYTAGPNAGTSTVRVTDSNLDTVDAGVTVQNTSNSPIDQSLWSLQFVSSELSPARGGTMAFDGDPDTDWTTSQTSTSTPPHDLQIDLGSVYEIDGFRVLTRVPSNGIMTSYYEFFVSEDGVAWGEPVASGEFPQDFNEHEVLFPRVAGQYVRITPLGEHNNRNFIILAELNVLGNVFSGNNPPNGTIDAPTTDLVVNAGDSVSFNGTYSDPNGHAAISYLWSFGDPMIPDSNVEDPGLITFNNPGTYTVTFMVTDSFGLTDPFPGTVTVKVLNGPNSVLSRGDWSIEYVNSEEVTIAPKAAENVLDGNVNTIWQSQQNEVGRPHEIQIDLGAAYAIDALRYLPPQAQVDGRIDRYHIYVSADGQDWGPPVAIGNFINSASEQRVAFSPKMGQFVRLVGITEVNGDRWSAVAELNLEGTCETPYVRLIEPLTKEVQSRPDLMVRAGVCLAQATHTGWGVKFSIDSGAQEQTITLPVDGVIHPDTFEWVVSGLVGDNHQVEAFIVDDQGIEVSGANTYDIVTDVGLGDVYTAVGDSTTVGVGDDDQTDGTSLDGRNTNTGVGYTPILNNMLTAELGYPHDVLNEGYSGGTSTDALLRLPAIVRARPKDTVFLVGLGLNDAATGLVPSGKGLNPGDPGYPGTFKANIQAIIDLLENASLGRSVYLAKVSWNGFTSQHADIQDYNIVIDELVSSNGISVIPPDLWTYFQSNQSELREDMLHPNGEGYKSMGRLWCDAITGTSCLSP